MHCLLQLDTLVYAAVVVVCWQLLFRMLQWGWEGATNEQEKPEYAVEELPSNEAKKVIECLGFADEQWWDEKDIDMSYMHHCFRWKYYVKGFSLYFRSDILAAAGDDANSFRDDVRHYILRQLRSPLKMVRKADMRWAAEPIPGLPDMPMWAMEVVIAADFKWRSLTRGFPTYSTFKHGKLSGLFTLDHTCESLAEGHPFVLRRGHLLRNGKPIKYVIIAVGSDRATFASNLSQYMQKRIDC